MQLFAILPILVTFVSALVSAVTIPGADTPLFYLVATGPESAGVNFLPVRLHGGSNYHSILTGTGPIAKFYFNQGQLVAVDPQSSSQPWRALINTQQVGSGSCANYGQLGTVWGSSSNKCATYGPFGLQSNPENAQIGSRLVFNWAGGFFVCGSQKEVWYKVNPSNGPSDCSPLDLYTVPVVE